MSIFGDMTRPEAGAYLRENRADLVGARDALVMAAQAAYATLKSHHAFEREMTCAKFVQAVLDAAYGSVSEEVVDFLSR